MKNRQPKSNWEMELQKGKGWLLFQFSVIRESLLKKPPKVTIENSTCSKQAGVELKKHPQREGTWLQSISAWCFFVLGWVMMCRSITKRAFIAYAMVGIAL